MNTFTWKSDLSQEDINGCSSLSTVWHWGMCVVPPGGAEVWVCWGGNSREAWCCLLKHFTRFFTTRREAQSTTRQNTLPIDCFSSISKYILSFLGNVLRNMPFLFLTFHLFAMSFSHLPRAWPFQGLHHSQMPLSPSLMLPSGLFPYTCLLFLILCRRFFFIPHL